MRCWARWRQIPSVRALTISDLTFATGLVAALFVVGVGFAVWRIRQPRYATLLLICAAVLLGGIMSSGSPQFHQLVPMAPVACLLAAIGLLGLLWPLDGFVYGDSGPTSPASSRSRSRSHSSWSG